jgi:antitoxin component of MazEF toxin-antitoxin module
MSALQKDHMKARIVHLGKSQGIYLPKALLKKAKLGGDVELRPELGRILISNTGKPRIGWAEAVRLMRAAEMG